MNVQDLINVFGPEGVDFELTTDLVFGGKALAKVRYYDVATDAMVTSGFVVRVWDVIGTIRGVTGNYGWGTFLFGSRTATDYPLVAVRQLQCS